MDQLSVQFGKRLRKLRKAKGLTQEQLGHASKVDWKYIGAIERGIKSPSFPVLSRVATALEVDPYELFLPDRLTAGLLEQQIKVVLTDPRRIDRDRVTQFFEELLISVRKIDAAAKR